MLVLAGLRYSLLMELVKIRKRIDKLLDEYPKTEDKEKLERQLEIQRMRLQDWYKVHGRG